MGNIVAELVKQGLLKIEQKFVYQEIQYLAYTGSRSYGSSTNDSDYDLMGICIPPKEYLFPHLRGEIAGFDGYKGPQFHEFISSKILDEQRNKEYEITVFSIPKFFNLLRKNSTTAIDLLFSVPHLVEYSSPIGNLIRDNRRNFLTKSCAKAYMNYASSQMRQIQSKKAVGKRLDIINQYGFDTKFAMHAIRLLLQAEQIFKEEDLDLLRNKDYLKQIREGKILLTEIKEIYEEKINIVEKLAFNSNLPEKINENFLYSLLVNCLTLHFDKISANFIPANFNTKLLNDLETLISDYRDIIK